MNILVGLGIISVFLLVASFDNPERYEKNYEERKKYLLVKKEGRVYEQKLYGISVKYWFVIIPVVMVICILTKK